MRRRPLIVGLMLVLACGGGPAAGPTGQPERIAQSWPIQLATDAHISDAELSGFRRWIGAGDGAWEPPGEGGPGPAAARARGEDGEAVARIAQVANEAACVLGRAPNALGTLTAAQELAARACVAGDTHQDATPTTPGDATPTTPGDATPTTPGDAPPTTLRDALRPALDLELDAAGELLRYRFLDPALPRIATALLPPARSTGALADRVGTDRWTAQSVAPPSNGPSGTRAPPATLAARELALADAMRQWQADLDATPDLDPATRTAVLGWVRRALAASSGAAAVREGDAAAGLVLLEEAVGGGRPRPGPALHPVLLSWLVLARWRTGELRGAAELLRDVGAQPGWEFAGVAAEVVARVAVIPSETDSRVRR